MANVANRALIICLNLIINNDRTREMVTRENKLINICMDGFLNITDKFMKLTIVRVLVAYFETVPARKSMYTIQRSTDVIIV